MTAVTMFTTKWCGYCKRLKRLMDEHGIEFAEVDIEEHPAGGLAIEEFTGGYRTVPTLEICGEFLVNPSIAEVQAALDACDSAAA